MHPIWSLFWFFFILVPLTVAWVFAIYDIFSRHDLTGWGKAGWFAAVMLVPWVGTFIYLLFRPQTLTRQEYRARAAAQLAYEQSIAADSLQSLADLHTRGKLTDNEFSAAKARVLGPPPGARPPEPASPWQSH